MTKGKQYLLCLCVMTAAAAAPGGAQTIGGCPVFPSNNIWNVRVDSLPVHSRSSAWVSSIGSTRTLHQDFGPPYDGLLSGIPINLVPGTQPKVAITFTDGGDESDPGPYPFPPNAQIENGSDQHVLVVDTTNCLLYETFYSFKNADNSWTVSSGAIFNLRQNLLRPAYWTSADAAGLPIMAGLVRYEEILAGEVKHALRFTVPRTTREFVWPGRHYASSVNDTSLPPMGARFRLKADFNISSFSPTTQIILTALKRYGMMLADNGSAWYVQGASDARWPDLADEWRSIPGSAFEAVDVSGLMVDSDSAEARAPAITPALDTAAFVGSSAVTAGQAATLRIGLTASAPAGGLLVAVASNNPSVANVASSSVRIPEGSMVIDLPVATASVPTQTQVVFTVSLAGVSRQATLTVNRVQSLYPPVLQSVTPSSGGGTTVPFSLMTSDADGVADIARVDLLIGPSLDWATGCHVVYSVTAGLVYLRNDSGAWTSATPGSAATLSNSRCSIALSHTSHAVSSSSSAVTTIPFQLASTFRGTHQIFARAYDRGGLDTSWRVLGAWSLAVPEAPVVRGFTPASGGGLLAPFVAVIGDNNGASDVARVDLFVAPDLDSAGCHVSYHVARRLIYLRNIDGSWQAGVPGSAGLLTNTRCSLDTAQAGTTSPSSSVLSVSIPIQFATPAFSGVHKVYVRTYDSVGLDTSWVLGGIWGAGIAPEPPQIVSLAPSSGSGEVANLALTVSDAAGTANLTRLELLAGPSLDSLCHFIYVRPQNVLYLRQADGSWQPGVPGSSGTLSNARCSADLAGVSRSVTEPSLTLTVPVRFGATLAGQNTVYVRAANQLGLDTYWRIAGSWTR